MCSFRWDMSVVVFVVQQVISHFLRGQHSSPQANPYVLQMCTCCIRTEACMLDCICNTKSGWGCVYVCVDLYTMYTPHMLWVINDFSLLPKPNFCGINNWKVLFCSMVAALFLEDVIPSRLLCCQNVHLDKRFYCFAKKKNKSKHAAFWVICLYCMLRET